MKNVLVLISLLLLASSSPVLAADAESCRQLLISQLKAYAEPDEAAAYFNDAEKAYRDCRSAKLPVDVRVKVLTKYGRAQYLRGQTQAAIQAYREALEILDSAPGDQTQMLLEVLDRAVSAETDAPLRSHAIAHASRALSLRQAKFGDASPEAIKAMVLLGAVHATFGDWDKWESLLRTAVRIAEKTCGPECEARAEAYSGMAEFYGTRGNEAEAKKYEEMALNATPPSQKRASQGKD